MLKYIHNLYLYFIKWDSYKIFLLSLNILWEPGSHVPLHYPNLPITRNERGDPWLKYYFFGKSSQTLDKIILNDQVCCSDSKTHISMVFAQYMQRWGSLHASTYCAYSARFGNGPCVWPERLLDMFLESVQQIWSFKPILNTNWQLSSQKYFFILWFRMDLRPFVPHFFGGGRVLYWI